MTVTTIDQLADVIYVGVMIVSYGLGFIAGMFR